MKQDLTDMAGGNKKKRSGKQKQQQQPENQQQVLVEEAQTCAPSTSKQTAAATASKTNQKLSDDFKEHKCTNASAIPEQEPEKSSTTARSSTITFGCNVQRSRYVCPLSVHFNPLPSKTMQYMVQITGPLLVLPY